MAKVISLRRKELVWEEYGRDWTEKDYEEFKEWLGNRTEDPHYATRYNAMKDVSFDDVCDILAGKRPDISYSLECGTEDNRWSYTESVGDYIIEMMREDAWDYGCMDSWGADDSEEDISIYE
jgi:hypothetical protein